MPRRERTKAKGDATPPGDASQEAVFTLKTPPGEPYRSAASAREAVDKLIAEASAETNAQPTHVKVFPNIQSFTVSGPPALVRKVAEHPEVASSMPNRPDEDMLIRPVKRTRTKTNKGRSG